MNESSAQQVRTVPRCPTHTADATSDQRSSLPLSLDLILDPLQAEIIYLHYFADLGLQEISQRIDLAASVVCANFSTGLRLFGVALRTSALRDGCSDEASR